jgi:hypothetical protein
MKPPDNPELPEPDAKQLCLNCTAPNETSVRLCANCGAPLASYRSTGQFGSVFAEGHVYRSAAERPRKLIVLLGTWYLFGLMALGGFALVASSSRRDGFLFGVVGVPAIAFSIVMLWKTTGNYFRKKPENHDA